MSASPSARAARRVMARCDQLAAISSSEEGIERVYLSQEHAAVNALTASWMREVGMETWQDAAGNQRGRVGDESKPLLVLGSHLDTVPDAGRYDGILGVMAAIEVVGRVVDDLDELPFAIEVIAFSDEEGTRFGKALMGSSAVAGAWEASWWELEDADGVSVREAFAAFGLEPERVGEAALEPAALAGYLEVHIEQAPVLEETGHAVGIVRSIAGARRFTIEIDGEAGHAGLVIPRRHDALAGASELVLAVERVAAAGEHVGTVGQLDVEPGGVNVVPGRVVCSLDLRAETDAARDGMWDEIEAAADEICARRGLRWKFRELHRAAAVASAPELMEAFRAAVVACDQPEPLSLLSRAGHDAMAIGAICDVAMLFVRNPGGISHHPDESVSVEDVAITIDVFTEAVRQLAEARASR